MQKRSTEGCSKFKSPETSSGEIVLDIRTHASHKVGQDQEINFIIDLKPAF